MNWEFLNRNIGNRLTPELAQGLYNAFQAALTDCYKEASERTFKAMVGDDTSVLVNKATVQVFDGYTFRIGSIEAEQAAIIPLHQAHFEELEKKRNPAADFCPRYDLWSAWERNNQFVLFVLEYEKQIVGNIGVYISRSKTNSQLVASEQFIYLREDHRKGWTGMKLLKFCEECLQAGGVKELVFSSHPAKDISPFLRRAGYAPGGTIFMKVLP